MRYLLLILLSGSTAFSQPMTLNDPAMVVPTTESTNVAASPQPYLTMGTSGTPRNDYPGSVGFQFVPSANCTITSLGRWVVAGNSQVHTIYIVDSGCNIIASQEVDCSSSGGGVFLYHTLATGVHLTEGTTYGIYSQEFSGGDQFLNSDTTFSITALGNSSSMVAAYTTSTTPSAGNCATTAYAVYGPPNFLYTTP